MSRSSAAGTPARAGEGAAAAVGLERAPQDQRLARLALDALLGQQREAPDGRREARISAATLACASPAAHQAGVGARAERQAERVEQDRLARAGLAGEHAKARLELELEPVDQHDVADRRAASASARRRPASAAAGQRRLRHVPLDQLDSCAGTIRCPDSWGRAPPPPSALPRACRGEIGFDQPLQRFGRVAGGLILVDHRAEADRRGQPVALSAGRSGRPPSPCRRDGR